MSIRRACSALKVERSLYTYKSRRGDQADLKTRIKEITQTRVRYGYRRVHVLLRREEWAVNPKRIYRLYKEMGLQIRNKVPKRRVKARLRDDRTVATHVNQTWAMDFVHDQLATGRKLRILTIVDTVRRQGFWDNWRGELTEALAHQDCHVRLPLLDEASGVV